MEQWNDEELKWMFDFSSIEYARGMRDSALALIAERDKRIAELEASARVWGETKRRLDEELARNDDSGGRRARAALLAYDLCVKEARIAELEAKFEAYKSTARTAGLKLARIALDEIEKR